MEINHDAPGNISQKGVNSNADNETGFDGRATAADHGNPSEHLATTGAGPQGDVDEELGFDPESPDSSDPAVDPTHPARTSNDPVPRGTVPEPSPEAPATGGRGI